MLNKLKSIGLFGGTFDPIHLGHLSSAHVAFKQLQLDQLVLIPNFIPAHRPKPQASADDRLAMLHLAIKSYPHFSVDSLEFDRCDTSYTIDTLRVYRERYPEAALYFMIGWDVFLGLPRWHCWQLLLDYTHLVVIARDVKHPNMSFQVQELRQKHQAQDIQRLKSTAAGYIYFLQKPVFDCSSSQVRATIRDGKSTDTLLLPQIADYIQEKGLYHEVMI